MELYTVDPANSFRRGKLIEHYESFIWTDRYSAYGDFSLTCEPSKEAQDRLKPDVLVGFTESDRMMQIHSILRTQDSKGKNVLKVQGKSIETVLEGRAAKKVLSAATWDIGPASIGAIVVNMVDTICIAGTGVSPDDVIPGLTATNLTGVGGSYTVKIKAGTLYERIKELVDSFDMGIRITFTPGVNALNFAAYVGTDRTGEDGVAFSPHLNNLAETSSLNSWADFKNGAYVFSNFGVKLVPGTGSSTLTGLSRRILLVDATDIPGPFDSAHDSALYQRGIDALADHRRQNMYDGKIVPNGPYKYNQHYFLGDLVVLLGDYGEKQSMRVTEHIWAYDSSGLNSYPTLRAIGGV